MPVFADDILRVSARMNVSDTGDCVNVYHFKLTAPTFVTDGFALADMALLMDSLYQCIDQHITERATFTDINVFDVTQDRPLGSTAWPTLDWGLAIGDMLPMQTAAFVRGLSGFSRNWSKKFLGPFSEGASIANGTISAGLFSALMLFGAEWLVTTATLTGTYIPVVHHKSTNAWKQIIDYAVTNIWATVRRRRAGRGA